MPRAKQRRCRRNRFDVTAERPLKQRVDRPGHIERCAVADRQILRERHSPIDLSGQAESTLVNGPIVPPAQKHQVLEACRPSVHPVLHVMCVVTAGRAARERQLRSRAWSARRIEGGTVRVLWPTSSTAPRSPWRIDTTEGVARHTSRRLRGDVHRAVIHLQRPPTDLPLPPHQTPPRPAPPDVDRRPCLSRSSHVASSLGSYCRTRIATARRTWRNPLSTCDGGRSRRTWPPTRSGGGFQLADWIKPRRPLEPCQAQSWAVHRLTRSPQQRKGVALATIPAMSS